MISLAQMALGGLWGSQIGRLLIVGVLALTFGFVKGWSIGRAGYDDALRARDLEWTLKIERANANAEADAQARVQAALAAVSAVAPAPADRSGIERLCADDSACRDRQRKK